MPGLDLVKHILEAYEAPPELERRVMDLARRDIKTFKFDDDIYEYTLYWYKKLKPQYEITIKPKPKRYRKPKPKRTRKPKPKVIEPEPQEPIGLMERFKGKTPKEILAYFESNNPPLYKILSEHPNIEEILTRFYS